MELLAISAFIGVVAVLVMAKVALFRSQLDPQAMESIARELQLTVIRGDQLSGQVIGFGIHIDASAGTRIRIDSGGRIPRSLRIYHRSEPPPPTDPNHLTFEDGDVKIRGPRGLLYTLIDDTVRKTLREAFDDCPATEIANGVLTRHSDDRIEGEIDVQRTIQEVRGLLNLGAALFFNERDVPERLAQMMSAQTPPWLRQQVLDVLIADYRPYAVTQGTLPAALKDSDPTVRLIAAHEIGSTAAETVLEILFDPQTSAEIRLRAMNIALNLHVVSPSVVQRLILERDPLLRAAAAKLVRTLGLNGIADLLIPLLRDPEDSVRDEARETLKTFGRLDSAVAGQVSLSESPHGDGRVSITQAPPPGALSDTSTKGPGKS